MMRRGLLLAVVLGLLALGAIGLMVARPARVVGVTGPSLADSLTGASETARGSCEEVEGGRLDETAWRCSVAGPGGSGIGARYTAQADEWGCWDARRPGGRSTELSACIWLLDYVHVLD